MIDSEHICAATFCLECARGLWTPRVCMDSREQNTWAGAIMNRKGVLIINDGALYDEHADALRSATRCIKAAAISARN